MKLCSVLIIVIFLFSCSSEYLSKKELIFLGLERVTLEEKGTGNTLKQEYDEELKDITFKIFKMGIIEKEIKTFFYETEALARAACIKRCGGRKSGKLRKISKPGDEFFIFYYGKVKNVGVVSVVMDGKKVYTREEGLFWKNKYVYFRQVGERRMGRGDITRYECDAYFKGIKDWNLFTYDKDFYVLNVLKSAAVNNLKYVTNTWEMKIHGNQFDLNILKEIAKGLNDRRGN